MESCTYQTRLFLWSFKKKTYQKKGTFVQSFIIIITGASAPNSRSTSPILPSKNPRFRDDLSLSLKRSRNPSGPCPLSPSREPPAKMFDMAGCSERGKFVYLNVLYGWL